jgi:D-3-phosphoglycerate dehydrogenase
MSQPRRGQIDQESLLNKPIVLVTAETVSNLARNLLREGGMEMVFMTNSIDEDDMIAALEQHKPAAILLRGSPPLSARVLAAGSGLKIIAKHGAGVDSVDIAAATKRQC